MEDRIDVDGCYAMNTVLGSTYKAVIANVTTRHEIVTREHYSVGFDLDKVSEYARIKLALSGPVSKAIPSAAQTYEDTPRFGKTKVSLYHSGVVVSTGYSSPEQLLLSAYSFLAKLNRTFNFDYKIKNFEIINIVSIVDTARPIDLQILKDLLQERCTYMDPVQTRLLYNRKGYPGAIVLSTLETDDSKIRNPLMVVFPTGITVLMGCCNRHEIIEMSEELHSYIEKVDAHAILKKQITVSTASKDSSMLTRQQIMDAAQEIIDQYSFSVFM